MIFSTFAPTHPQAIWQTRRTRRSRIGHCCLQGFKIGPG
jgi:hypothetical protein